MTRNGKIARLPRETRDALNRRLQDNEPGTALLAWLNALPEVQALLTRDFAGCAISKQNLSEWRAGGFAEWQSLQDALARARELSADAQELTEAAGGQLTDHLATLLAARYAAALAGWNGELTDASRRNLRALRALCQDVVELRRGDHSGTRLKIEQARLEREREKTDEEVVEHFQRWAQNPAVRDCLCQNWASPADRERRVPEMFGLAPRPADEPAPAQTSSPAPPAGAPPAPDPSDESTPGPTKSNQVKPSFPPPR